MTTAYTSLLGLALPVTGELDGTWGDTVNDYITSYLDAAVAGAQTISGTQTAVTLSTTNGLALSQAGSGATGSAQYAIINCTGSPAGLLTITAPATSKAYLVLNNTSTNQSVKVVGSGPTTGVTVAAARCALIAWNGSDFEVVASTDVATLQGLGTGVATALGIAVNTAGGFTTIDGTATLTNKTISADNNTISGIAASSFVLSNASGNIDGAAAQKAIPTGVVVGTTDSQTLTNKTLTTPTVNGASLSGTFSGNATFSGTNTFGNASGQTFLASTTTTQDGVVINGRAGGTLSYRVTLAPTTLTASRAITLPDAAGTVVLDTATQTLTNKTLAGAVLNDGYTEEVFAVTGTTPALSPNNGSIQTWTLTGAATPTQGTWAAGQSITLMIDDGTAYTINWGSIPVTWKTNGGVAPTLLTTGITPIVLWKVGTIVYGARVGDA